MKYNCLEMKNIKSLNYIICRVLVYLCRYTYKCANEMHQQQNPSNGHLLACTN